MFLSLVDYYNLILHLNQSIMHIKNIICFVLEITTKELLISGTFFLSRLRRVLFFLHFLHSPLFLENLIKFFI